MRPRRETDSRGRSLKKIVGLLSAGALAVGLGFSILPSSGLLPSSWTSEASAAAGKVTICHRTRSVTNPYRLITVSQNAVSRNSGHKSHIGGVFNSTANYYKASGSAARDWGDIVPGSDADGAPYNGGNSFAKNWDASGKAFFPGGANAGLCSRMTALQFYNAQVSARSGLSTAEQTAYGLDDSQIMADLNDQEANEDAATLAALGGAFSTSNISTSDTLVTATTDPATGLGQTGATLNGTIKAGTVGVRWQFEYGTSSSLLSPSTTTISAATDNDVDMITSSTVAVGAPLTGLAPSTTYYYRVVGVTNYGTDTEGVIYGSILNFTTSAAGTFTVTFNANGGSGSMANQSGTSSTALTPNSFTRTGFTFAGWNTASDGSGTSFANGASYSFTADATLYARWSATSNAVTYNANGGTGAPADGSALTGSTFTVSSSAPTRSGYTFAGWNTASNGSGTSYASSATFTMPAGSVILYAKWTAIAYAVTFNANGGSGSMASQSGTSSTALTPNSFTRTGYSFAGWNTASDGSGTSYADGASYSFTADATLYARWSATSNAVTYNANGGTGAPADGSALTGSTFTVSSSAPTRSGYTFAGWNTASNGSGTSYASSATFTMPAGSVILYAKWTSTAGGGSGSGGSGGGNGNSGGNSGNSGGSNGSSGNTSGANGNSAEVIRPVTSGPLTPPATTTTTGTTNQSVAPLPTLTVPLTTGDNTAVVVTKVENKGPGKVEIDERGRLKITVPIGFSGKVTVLVNGYEKDQCTTTANGTIACPVGTTTPIQQTVQVQVAGPNPQVVPDQRAADLPRGFAPRSGEVVVVGMDSEVGLNWKQEAGTQYYQVSSGGETVCMTVYTSCIVPAQNRRSRSYVVSSVKPDGESTNVAKGTGWARPAGTRMAAVYFDSASGELTKQSLRTLSKMVRDVKALGIGSVYVIGHTDTRGSIQYNRRLSEERARNVHDWIENHLEDAVFNEQSPQGEFKPAFSEQGNPGDWRNRRVDVLVQ